MIWVTRFQLAVAQGRELAVALSPIQDYDPALRKGAAMPKRVDRFIHGENIKNFELRIETDPVRLALLKALLRDEKARLPEDPEAAWRSA